MAKLIVLHKQKQIQELELTTEKVTIGREADCTIILEDSLVSRKHAEIREEGGKYFLTDIGSANGTFVGTRRITTNYELKSGDVIKISPYTMYFQLSAAETPTRIEQPERPEDKTKIIGVTGLETGELGRDMTQMYTYSGAPKLLIRSGVEVGKTFDLSKNPIIGRDAECDIVLSEPTISRKHARIQFIDNKLSVIDVGSRSGTRVNGKIIDKPTPLKDSDKIQLGDVTLEIDWKGAPKAVEEKATVPYFRPEPVAPAKAEWWKWAVGIAAGIIIIIAAWLILPPIINPDPLSKLPASLLIDNAQTHYEDGTANKSDTIILNTALHEITVALKKEKTNARAGKVKTSIMKALQDIKVAFEYYESALNSIQKGDLEQAILDLTVAREKDPNNEKVKELKIKTHKTLATNAEIEGDKIRSKDRRTSNEFYDKAIANWTAVRQLDQNDTEAARKIVELKNKRGIISVIGERVKTDYEIAEDLYYNGKLPEARAKAEKLPKNYQTQFLLDRITLWEEANYILERLFDTTAATAKYDELYNKDQKNTIVRDILSNLGKVPIGVSKPDTKIEKERYDKAEPYWKKWIDYGDLPALREAQSLYTLIKNDGPPPSNASSEELDIFNNSIKRLEAKSQ